MIYMDNIKKNGFGESNFNYEIKAELSSGETSQWIVIPDNVSKVLVSLYISSGSGKVQETNDLLEDIDTTTLINDWIYGTVTENQNGVLLPVKAFRFVCESGNMIGTGTAR